MSLANNSDDPTIDKSRWVLIENEGALFRGPARTVPRDLWSVREQAWVPYADQSPKRIEWGWIVSEAEAEEFKRA